MTLQGEDGIARMHKDHALIFELGHRINMLCGQEHHTSCSGCDHDQVQQCRGNIVETIRHLIEVTLKHTAIEAILMKEHASHEHCVAHSAAHAGITTRMSTIKRAIKGGANCIIAIEQVKDLLQALKQHEATLDGELEQFIQVNMQA